MQQKTPPQEGNKNTKGAAVHLSESDIMLGIFDRDKADNYELTRADASVIMNSGLAVHTTPFGGVATEMVPRVSQFDLPYSALSAYPISLDASQSVLATSAKKEVTREEVERLEKLLTVLSEKMEKSPEPTVAKYDKTTRAELLASMLPEIIQHIETQKKEAESAIGQEDASFLSQKFANGEYLEWGCKQCKTFIARLDSLPVVAGYLKNFSEEAMERCSKHGHLNWFKINKGRINWGIETEIGFKFLWKRD